MKWSRKCKGNVGVSCCGFHNKETPAFPLHFLDLFTSLHNVKVIKQKLGKCCFFFIVDWSRKRSGKVVAGGKSWILGRYGGDGGCSLGCQQSHDSEDSDDDANHKGQGWWLWGGWCPRWYIWNVWECVISFLFAFSLLIIIIIIIKSEIRKEVKSRLN